MHWPNLKWLRRLLPRQRPAPGLEQSGSTDDIHLKLNGLHIDFSREIGLSVPHEVSVYVPRAEIRRKWEDQTLVEDTVVLNSITIVHAPRHVPIEAFSRRGSDGNPNSS